MLAALSALYLWAVARMTLTVAPYGSDIAAALNRLVGWFAERPSTAWITLERIEFGANVLMFVPLGVFVVLWFGVRFWWTAPLLGLAASGAIELAQAVLLPSRVSDPRDLIANTAGAVVGMLLMLLLAFLLSSSRPARR